MGMEGGFLWCEWSGLGGWTYVKGNPFARRRLIDKLHVDLDAAVGMHLDGQDSQSGEEGRGQSGWVARWAATEGVPTAAGAADVRKACAAQDTRAGRQGSGRGGWLGAGGARSKHARRPFPHAGPQGAPLQSGANAANPAAAGAPRVAAGARLPLIITWNSFRSGHTQTTAGHLKSSKGRTRRSGWAGQESRRKVCFSHTSCMPCSCSADCSARPAPPQPNAPWVFGVAHPQDDAALGLIGLHCRRASPADGEPRVGEMWSLRDSRQPESGCQTAADQSLQRRVQICWMFNFVLRDTVSA